MTVSAEPSTPDPAPEWLAVVRDQVEHLRFGVVQIVVHEHQVVQVERTEKVRFDKPRSTVRSDFAHPATGGLNQKQNSRPTVTPEVAPE